MSVAIGERLRPEFRAPVVWGVLVGVAQAATPLAFWWLDAATVYALGLVGIAFIYIAFWLWGIASGSRITQACLVPIAPAICSIQAL